jgi:hypothetical protein
MILDPTTADGLLPFFRDLSPTERERFLNLALAIMPPTGAMARQVAGRLQGEEKKIFFAELKQIAVEGAVNAIQATVVPHFERKTELALAQQKAERDPKVRKGDRDEDLRRRVDEGRERLKAIWRGLGFNTKGAAEQALKRARAKKRGTK